jgi:hypothetical protein
MGKGFDFDILADLPAFLPIYKKISKSSENPIDRELR